ncbi:hypothetical protein MAHJHV59_49550 [Mycobacterium avium subsp. hominissuis]
MLRTGDRFSRALFAPEDLALVRGDPSERRRYLDDLATLRRPAIAAVRCRNTLS